MPVHADEDVLRAVLPAAGRGLHGRHRQQARVLAHARTRDGGHQAEARVG